MSSEGSPEHSGDTMEAEGGDGGPAPTGPSSLGLDTTEPEFYDPDADAKDERWMGKLRKGRTSDALLSCPLCFTTVCIECQQHAVHDHQFRAMFAMNCRIDKKQLVKSGGTASQPKSRRRQKAQEQEAEEEAEERYHPVYCAVCEIEIGLRETAPDGVYHFFNVVASNA